MRGGEDRCVQRQRGKMMLVSSKKGRQLDEQAETINTIAVGWGGDTVKLNNVFCQEDRDNPL